MSRKTIDEDIVKALRQKLDGQPTRCMAIATRTGERCNNLARRVDNAFCGHHRGAQKAVR